MIHNWISLALLTPDDFRKTVYDIDLADLQQRGFRAILIDLDNTLIPYDETMPSENIKQFFAAMSAHGFEVIIISNNHMARVEAFAKALGVPFICSAKKPLKTGFRRAMSLIPEIPKEQIVVIGDQFMTDVFGGKRMGLYVIVVNAIKRNVEKWYTKMNRKWEWVAIHRIKKTKPELYQKLGLHEKR